MKKIILKTTLISFLTTFIIPYSFAQSTLDQAKKANQNSSATFDGNLNKSSSIGSTNLVTNFIENKKEEDKAKEEKLKQEEEANKQDSYMTKLGKDLKENKFSYLVAGGAGALAGYLLFGGLLGPIGFALGAIAFIAFSRGNDIGW